MGQRGSLRTSRQLALALSEVIEDLAQRVGRSLREEGPGGPWGALWRRYGPRLELETFAAAWAQTRVYLAFVARYAGWSSAREGGLSGLDPAARPLFEVEIGAPAEAQLDALDQLLAGLDLAQIFAGAPDPILHFYEELLDVHAPEQRQRAGVYYTPDALVRLVLSRVHRGLQSELGLELGLADPSSWAELVDSRGAELPAGVGGADEVVRVLDPAAGTGAFLVELVEWVHAQMQAQYNADGLDAAAASEAWRVYVRAHLLARVGGIELMLCPWVVCLVRLRMCIERTGCVLGPDEGVAVQLGDALTNEARGATVILGNPPFAREPARAEGEPDNWARDQLLPDYIDAARASGAGAHVKNLYNLYVYFWRWASWELFERAPRPGIVAFVSASSYLRGPGFVAMRSALRRAADLLEIIELGGESRGTRASANVFNIATPVCLGVLVSRGELGPEAPQRLLHARVEGTREAKLERCLAWSEPRRGELAAEPVPWRAMPAGSPEVLIAGGRARYRGWPRVTELFPWQHSGAQFKRTWPIAATPELLTRRWRALAQAPAGARAALLRETRDRKANRVYSGPRAAQSPLAELESLGPEAELPELARYAFRSWDRQWCLADARLGDFLRPALWRVDSPRQIYMSSLLAGVIGPGPAATVSAHVPDLHHFRGSYGGKDVIPLWRDAAASEPNLVRAHASIFAEQWGQQRPWALFCYVYALLANPGYARRFADELEVPGPRVPLTRDPALFERGVELGAALLGWHCYGERALGEEAVAIHGRARVLEAIPTDAARYPESYTYDPERGELRVGEGRIGPVVHGVWAVSVSGLGVLESWLAYRMRAGAGRRSSALDELRPSRWTAQLSRELLELVWVLDWTLAQLPGLEQWLEAVLAGPLFAGAQLPSAAANERRGPG